MRIFRKILETDLFKIKADNITTASRAKPTFYTKEASGERFTFLEPKKNATVLGLIPTF